MFELPSMNLHLVSDFLSENRDRLIVFIPSGSTYLPPEKG